jgi:hypothetical protein
MKYLKSARVPAIQKHTIVERHNLMKLLYLAGIVVSFALSACDFGKVEAQTATKAKKENNMESIQSGTTVHQTIPPIDAVTPPEIETATFALG